MTTPHKSQAPHYDAVAALENLTVLSLTMPVWSGTKVTHPNSMLPGGAALPTTLVTNGGKKVIDPKQLNVFSALRRQAPDCSISGRRVAGRGYVPFPTDLADAIVQKLELIIDEYEHAHDFWPTDKYVEEWSCAE